MNKRIILTGSMGTGKSTLLKVLQKEGINTISECARTILAEQRSFGGYGVPDEDPKLFCELLLSRTLYEFTSNTSEELTIYDRGLPDIIAYAKLFKLDVTHYINCAKKYRYKNIVFLLEPWEEIFVNDEERKMTFGEVKLFHDDLIGIYNYLNYKIITVPKITIKERAYFIIQKLGLKL